MDIAWAARVGVLFDGGEAATNALTDQGWTVCPPEAATLMRESS
ncbi:hypothetical protein ABZ552_13005 [Nocardia sp. NPDC019219]|nr:hypothetical protein [Nocardia sputorum]